MWIESLKIQSIITRVQKIYNDKYIYLINKGMQKIITFFIFYHPFKFIQFI